MKKNKSFCKLNTVLGKCTLYYLFFSLIPLLLLYYVFFSAKISTGVGSLMRERGEVLWGIALLGSLLGFIALRSVLKKVVLLNNFLKRINIDKIDQASLCRFTDAGGEIAELTQTFDSMITCLIHNRQELEKRKNDLYTMLHNVGKASSISDDFDSRMNIVLQAIGDAVSVEKGAIVFYNENGAMRVHAWVGKEKPEESEVIEAVRTYVEYVQREKKTYTHPPLLEEIITVGFFNPPFICIPIVFKNAVCGALCISGGMKRNNFTQEEIVLLENMSLHIALAFGNMQVIKEKERAYFETISSLALQVESRDPYSQGHSERVMRYTEQIGKKMKLDQTAITMLRDAALLHDIGKIGISETILLKTTSLKDEEMKMVKLHPAMGEKVVMPLRTFRHLVNPIRHHHEFLDGTGYPDGLHGEQIPLITRILVVADIYVSLTEERPYRKALSEEESLRELDILAEKGKVDREVVACLETIVHNYTLTPVLT